MLDFRMDRKFLILLKNRIKQITQALWLSKFCSDILHRFYTSFARLHLYMHMGFVHSLCKNSNIFPIAMWKEGRIFVSICLMSTNRVINVLFTMNKQEGRLWALPGFPGWHHRNSSTEWKQEKMELRRPGLESWLSFMSSVTPGRFKSHLSFVQLPFLEKLED